MNTQAGFPLTTSLDQNVIGRDAGIEPLPETLNTKEYNTCLFISCRQS